MSRRTLRIATTKALEHSARVAGFDTFLLPQLPSDDFNRSIQERLADGEIYRPFLEEHDIDLVLDYNTSALTLVRSKDNPDHFALTTAELGIAYVACYLDPITSTMAKVSWLDHWHLLESSTWVKWVFEVGHADELKRLGIPNVLTMPIAIGDEEFNTDPLPDPDPNPAVAFMGHPASSWFKSQQTFLPAQLVPGLTAAAVHADMPDLTFQKIYYDLYEFGTPPQPSEERTMRAQKAMTYFNEKFTYNAYLAIKQRDRFVRFLKQKLGSAFEIIGDHWKENYDLEHTPRIWDMKVLHERMRQVPICLNLHKGCVETGLNFRHFEITAHGGFMLTYEVPELSNCFEIGTECDVFHDEAELLDKIKYYLDQPQKRREIAAAGQQRTLKEHLYSHRITTLVELLRRGGMLPKLDAATPQVAHAPVGDVLAPSSTPQAPIAPAMVAPREI